MYVYERLVVGECMMVTCLPHDVKLLNRQKKILPSKPKSGLCSFTAQRENSCEDKASDYCVASDIAPTVNFQPAFALLCFAL